MATATLHMMITVEVSTYLTKYILIRSSKLEDLRGSGSSCRVKLSTAASTYYLHTLPTRSSHIPRYTALSSESGQVRDTLSASLPPRHMHNDGLDG